MRSENFCTCAEAVNCKGEGQSVTDLYQTWPGLRGEQAKNIPTHQLIRGPQRHPQRGSAILLNPVLPSNGVRRRNLDRPDICHTFDAWPPVRVVCINKTQYGTIPTFWVFRKIPGAKLRRPTVHLSTIEKVGVSGAEQECDLAS